MATTLSLPSVLIDYVWNMDGVGLVGKTPKIKLPELEKVTEEYIAGGMAGTVKIDMAAVGELTSTVTLAESNPDVFKQFGLLNGQEKLHVFRAATRGKDGVKGFRMEMQARITKIDMSEIERKNIHTTDIELSINVLKIFFDNNELIHINIEAGIFSVGGVNQRADINTALGI